ncbi:MAG: AraC family transcriptional regulator [Phycisphaeraceae bacterium]|nr:AraC family transcriptional regulator [Phycisphaeraceae bacterium]
MGKKSDNTFAPLPPDLFDKWPIKVRQMGRSIFDPIWAEREHRDSNSELIHVLRGHVRIETPTYTLKGVAGDTLFTPANTPHRDIFPRDTIFEVYLVQIQWADEEEVLKQFSPIELAEVSGMSQAMFSNAFDQLYREFTTESTFQQPMLAVRAGQILYELCRAAARRKYAASESPQLIASERRRQIMTDTRKLIATWLDQPISLDALAQAIDVSPYYLSRVFSQENGFTLSSYLTQQRMEKARQLLTQTTLSIKEVAYAVGYRDSHYFSRVFRGAFYISPSAYRRQAEQ